MLFLLEGSVIITGKCEQTHAYKYLVEPTASILALCIKLLDNTHHKTQEVANRRKT